jgi:tetratricopeptide (TPR) repeat protein
MRRTSLSVPCRALAALALALGATWTAQAGEPSPRQRVLALGQTTGEETLRAEVKALTADPDQARRLISTALQMAKAKEKERALGYNAAYVLAQVAADLKDVKGSVALYRVCAADAARLQSTSKLLDSYEGLINVLLDNKKYAQADKVCRELLELKTHDGKPRIYYLGRSGPFGALEPDEEEDFDAAKRLRPYVHQLRIQAIAKQGKYDEALKLADNQIRAQDTWQRRRMRAWVLHEAGRYAEAAKAYEEVVRRIEKDKDIDPADKAEVADRYRYILSGVYVELNQLDKAATVYKDLIKKHPQEPGYYNDLGYVWADRGMNLPEAEKLIRKALELDREKRKKAKVPAAEDRDNGAYLDSLGWVLFKQKKYAEAKKVLQEAVKDKNSQHIEIYDHLAEVLMALGERGAAIAAWQRGVELAGDSQRERQRRAAVEKKLAKHQK